jgi:hypothetical protein
MGGSQVHLLNISAAFVETGDWYRDCGWGPGACQRAVWSDRHFKQVGWHGVYILVTSVDVVLHQHVANKMSE